MYLANKDHPLTVVAFGNDVIPDAEFVTTVINLKPWSKDLRTASGIVYWLLMAGF